MTLRLWLLKLWGGCRTITVTDEFYELLKKVAEEIPRRFATAKRWEELSDELWDLKEELFEVRIRKAREECRSQHKSKPEQFLACLREKLKKLP